MEFRLKLAADIIAYNCRYLLLLQQFNLAAVAAFAPVMHVKVCMHRLHAKLATSSCLHWEPLLIPHSICSIMQVSKYQTRQFYFGLWFSAPNKSLNTTEPGYSAKNSQERKILQAHWPT